MRRDEGSRDEVCQQLYLFIAHNQYYLGIGNVLRIVSNQCCSGALMSCHARARVIVLSAPASHRLSLITNFSLLRGEIEAHV